MTQVTSASLLAQTVRLLNSSTSTLGKLQEQLSSQTQNTDLADYGASTARTLLNLGSGVQRLQSYQNAIQVVQPRLDTVASSLTGLQNDANSINGAISSANTFDSAQASGLAEQIQNAMNQANYYLNQQIDGRYLFAGSRYTTQPVGDITSLPVPPTEPYPFTPVASPALPSYDTEAPATNAQAYDQSTVTIDDGITNSYGTSSDDPAIQKYIMGLRWAYAATQDPANYSTYMAQANQLLTDSSTELGQVQAKVAASQSAMKTALDNQTTNINYLTSQSNNIQAVDQNAVAAAIQQLTSQLEASYSASGKILGLSIVDYLSS